MTRVLSIPSAFRCVCACLCLCIYIYIYKYVCVRLRMRAWMPVRPERTESATFPPVQDMRSSFTCIYAGTKHACRPTCARWHHTTYVEMKSGRFSIIRATTSPVFRPAWTAQCATRFAMASISAYVYVVPSKMRKGCAGNCSTRRSHWSATVRRFPEVREGTHTGGEGIRVYKADSAGRVQALTVQQRELCGCVPVGSGKGGRDR